MTQLDELELLGSEYISSTSTDFLLEQGQLWPKRRRAEDEISFLCSRLGKLATLMEREACDFFRSPTWLFQLASDEAVGVVRKERLRKPEKPLREEESRDLGERLPF